MLNELLNLSKLEAGKMELRPTVLSLQELLTDLAEVFQPVAQRKSITMDIGSMEDMPKVCVDRDKLYEVLANFCSRMRSSLRHRVGVSISVHRSWTSGISK